MDNCTNLNVMRQMVIYENLQKVFYQTENQKDVLNGQTSEWNKIKAGVSQGSILGPLFFLIYINDLPSALYCSSNLFADDILLFSIVKDVKKTAKKLMGSSVEDVFQF